ncbi:MAG TPA: DUF3732 domain-containing protein [Bryobacteraceae bacterium]|jgi:hypothetical protein
MDFQLKEVILWPRNRTQAVRRVAFETGAVNVITGASQTGKSAIVPIVDYCLGSGRCAIPVNTIRDLTDWFGVVVQTPKGQLLLARKEPGEFQSTSEMYIQEGASVVVPETAPSKNTNRDFVKTYLDELAGLTTLDFDPDSSGTFRARPSFRDLAAFMFQPQNVIANPDVLFFKADTMEHRQKLQTIFPYVLGVLTPDILAKRHRLDELRKQERRLTRQLDAMKQSSDRWLAELHIAVSQARELGLVPISTEVRLPQDQAIRLLRGLVNREYESPRVSENTIDSVMVELTELRNEESELSIEMTQLRQRWVEMSRLRRAASEYRAALQVEEQRLGISEWLLNRSLDLQSCPICGNEMEATHQHLGELVDSLREVERTRTEFRTLPETFDREYSRVRTRLNTLADQLSTVQKRISALQSLSEKEARHRYTELSASRFLGRLEADLALFDRLNSDNELLRRREELAREISELTREVDEKALKAKEQRALDRLSALVSRLLPDLGVEKPEDPVSLSITELTLKIKRLHREDFLWEVGSGSNWLSYHVATALALHEYFAELPGSPVPSFLVLDQPSQVYFPKKLAASPTEMDLDPKLAEDDVQRVHKIFEVLAAVSKTLGQKFQIIVLDHAADTVWGNILGVHLIEEWRDGAKLIPAEWIQAGAR